MQNHFYQRFNQGQGNFDGVDHGTWQQPMQRHGQEDTYFTGSSGSNINYYTNQQSSGSAGSNIGNSAQEGIDAVFQTGIASYSKNKGSVGLRNASMGNQTHYMSDSQQARNSSHFMSNQDRSAGKITHGSQDDGYYGFPDESYVTNSAGSMGTNSGSGVGGGTGSFVGSSVNMKSNSVNSGSSSSIGNNTVGGSVGNSAAFNMNMVGGHSSGGMMGVNNVGNNTGMNNSKNFGNTNLQNQLIAAAVGLGALANWQKNLGNNLGFNQPPGNLVNSRRGKRGRGFGFNPYRGSDMSSRVSSVPLGGQQWASSGSDLTVNLSATNYNQWCFLRKSFNKDDNELAEHLFDIHEKFCHHCKERIDQKKYGKKKKMSEDSTDAGAPSAEEVPDEDLTEEELEMKKLMGFAGFRTTKGARVKDNNYSACTASTINVSGSGASADQSTTLTETEKQMIAVTGGFSVFNRSDTPPSSSPDFGAPAVSYYPVKGRGQGSSDRNLFNSSTDLGGKQSG